MLLWVVAALVAGFIKGLCGVGDAPVFSSIMSFAENNIDISPVSLIPSLPANLYITWQNRKALQRRVWVPMALLLIAGTIPGTILLKNADTGKLKLFFGFFIIFVGILMLFNELNTKKVKPSKWLLFAVGVISGISSGLFGIGVMLIVYITMTTNDMRSFKGNICAIFASENIIRLVMYLILGMFTK
ncbi:MAG: sulfite exporter TauE/SafE family protein, partial [Flexilinea sp.]|nr:sulfite exporter TauE/SafE family protein [Flexilinea sp.]